jgi:AcrR family transcriptional regulator
MGARVRPKDRRNQLASVAADLFRRHGYHNVGVNDIAAAAGITGPAVYRHFRSKQEILGHVVLAGADQLSAAVHDALDRACPTASAAERLDVLLRSLARLSVERRELGALWRREGRSLPAGDRARLAARLSQATRFGAELVRGVRPELSADDAALLCSAALSVFASISDHHTSVPRARFERLLLELALAICHSDAVPADPVDRVDGRLVSSPLLQARREQLLAVAARMFGERGFHDVTMEDIGSAAGIAGPSIYRHYDSKADLLLAMCGRVRERLREGLARALGAGSPAEVLHALAGSFVDAVLSHRDLVAAFLTERHNLPERDRSEARRALRGYVAEWVRVVVAAAPALDEKEARIRVHAAFAVVNDLARGGRFAARPALGDELTTLALAVLVPQPPARSRT